MRHFMSGRPSICKLLFVLVALAAIAAHVCVLPGHVHATPVGATGHDHTEPASDDHPAADGVHAASCEALRPAATVPAAACLASAPSSTVPVDIAPGAVDRAANRPSPASSPPLYLAHRALLI